MSLRCLLFTIAAMQAVAQTRTVTDAEVKRVHASALLIDSHNDVTSRTVAGFDIGPRSTTGHTDIQRLREGGVGAQFFAAYVAAEFENGNHSARRTLEMIDTVRHDIIERYPKVFQLALTADEISAAHKHGKIAALLGIEGGHGIEDSVRLLRDYYALGVRYMTLTHVNTNNWADSSGDMNKAGVAHHNGLTDQGKDIVREMNRLGMMVDISHVADKTFWDVLETSSAPPFASHSSCRALSNVPRNMTDEMIAALAKKGGVVQINFACQFLSQKSADATVTPMPRATLADVVAHIDHAVKIGGIGAVGLGSDFDGIQCSPEGLDEVSKFPNLTRALLEKGYSAADIRKIYGGNLLRVMHSVEKESARLRALPPVTVESIVEKNAEARGGAQRMRDVKRVIVKGQIQFGSAPASAFLMKAERPDKFFVQFTLGGKPLVQAYDGKTAWEITPDSKDGAPGVVSGGALENILDQAEGAISGPFLDYREHNAALELLGIVNIEGKPCYKLKLTAKNGHVMNVFIDTHTYLEIYEELLRSWGGAEHVIIETVGDYKTFGGVLWPGLFVSGSKEEPAQQRLIIESIEVNAPMDDSVFGFPGKN